MLLVVGIVGGYTFIIHSFEKIAALCCCYLAQGRSAIAKCNQRQTSGIKYLKCKQTYQSEYAKTDRWQAIRHSDRRDKQTSEENTLPSRSKNRNKTANRIEFGFCPHSNRNTISTPEKLSQTVHACILQHFRSDISKDIID
uniref:Uncharacterized protein n=1 Tax=Glossina palpalis gambiensis TaxID=67801 RepID=A0A1B0BEL8_9MUSC